MDEEYRVKRIPANYQSGVNLFGNSFRPVFLLEGIILAITSFFLSFKMAKLYLETCDVSQIIGVSLVFSGLLLFAGVKGINDEPITTFVYNYFRFVSHKRIAFYNPRVKTEAVFFKDRNCNEKTDYRIVEIRKYLQKVAQGNQKTKDKRYWSEQEFNPETMSFQDDAVKNEKKKRK